MRRENRSQSLSIVTIGIGSYDITTGITKENISCRANIRALLLCARVGAVRRCAPAEMSNDEDVGSRSSGSGNDGGRNGSRNDGDGRRSRGSVT